MRAATKRHATTRLAAAAAVAAALAAAACGDVLEVKNPGPIPDEDLNRPDAVQSLVNGMGPGFRTSSTSPHAARASAPATAPSRLMRVRIRRSP